MADLQFRWGWVDNLADALCVGDGAVAVCAVRARWQSISGRQRQPLVLESFDGVKRQGVCGFRGASLAVRDRTILRVSRLDETVT